MTPIQRPRVVGITQARMSSTRLPGKVLREVQGKPLLLHHAERARRVRTLDAFMVATTVNPADDRVAATAAAAGFPVFRGSEDDVLSRFIQAAEHYRADIVVRLNADCPLIDPAVVDHMVQAFLDRWPDIDYASNRLVHTYPRGLDAEITTLAALREADAEAEIPEDREHVTYFIWHRPDRYRLLNVPSERDLKGHRWTVDTPEDFELVRRILDDLYPRKPEFTLQDCLDVLAEHPDWPSINAHVEQRLLP